MRSRTKKRIGISLIILLILIVVGIFTIPKLIDPNNYNKLIVKNMKEALGGQINLGHISWGISNGIWAEVDRLSIVDAPDIPGDVTVSRLYAKAAFLPLLTMKVVLKQVLIESPEFKMKLGPEMNKAKGGTEDDDATAAGTETTGFSLPVEIEIAKLTVKIDRFELEDTLTLPGQTLLRKFKHIDLEASRLALGEEMAFDLSLRDEAAVGLGEIKAEGTFSGLTKSFTLENPNLKVEADVSGLHTDIVKPYLKDNPLGKSIGGIVDMEVNYEGDLIDQHKMEGELDLSEFTYTDPTLFDAPLPGKKTTLSFQATLDQQDITVENMALKLGGLSLTARADVKNIDKDAVIKNAELSFDLPLAEVIPLVPWKSLGKDADVIRSKLEGGGKIVANKVLIPDIPLSEFPPNVDDMLSRMEMDVQVVGITVQPFPNGLKLKNINGTIHLVNGIAQLKGFQSQFGSATLPEVSAKISNLMEKPKIDASINGRLKINETFQEEYGRTLRDLGLEKMAGAADVAIDFELETARPEDFQVQGKVGLRDMLVKTTYSPAFLQGLNADIALTPDVADISRLSSTVSLKENAASPKEQFNLEFKGRIDDWRRKPAITIHGFKTSPIFLSLLAAMIPWDQLGETSKPAKEILASGGTLTIKDLALPKIDLSKPPKDPTQLIPKVKLAAVFDDITVPSLKKTLPRVEGITGSVHVENDILSAEKVSAKVGPLSLPTIQAHVNNLSRHPKVTMSAKGPIKVAATENEDLKKLLNEYGLRSLTGSAVVDMHAGFDRAKPESWTANGSLMLNGINAVSHPAGVTMDNLKGGLTFIRKQTMDITVEDVTTTINRAPVRLSGKFSHLGTPNMLISTDVHTKQLDLSQLGELLPTLKEFKLGGLLDMNVSAYIPYASPTESRLNGSLTTKNAGFQLDSSDLLIKKANTHIELAGQDAKIETMTMIVNDQQLSLSGNISNPVEPKVQLLITSPTLDLGRLIPHKGADAPASKPIKNQGSKQQPAPARKTAKTELPPMARKLTADLQVQADQGQFRRIQFRNLDLKALYNQGVVEKFDLNFGTEKGQVKTNGSIDLRDLNQIAFMEDHDISGIDLERLASVYDIEKLPITGPMAVKGQLQGRTGKDVKALLGSLDGHLKMDMGPGHLKEIGRLGHLFGKIFSLASLQSIFSGRMLKDLSGDGVRYNIINADTTITKGTLNNNIHLGSDAMNVNSQGTVDLVNETIKTKAVLEPLATVNKALDFVPILGKAASNLIKVRIDVEGPLEDPKVRASQIKQVGTAVESIGEGTADFLEGVGKGLKGLFGK